MMSDWALTEHVALSHDAPCNNHERPSSRMRGLDQRYYSGWHWLLSLRRAHNWQSRNQHLRTKAPRQSSVPNEVWKRLCGRVSLPHSSANSSKLSRFFRA
jgi:hypothetical protein